MLELVKSYSGGANIKFFFFGGGGQRQGKMPPMVPPVQVISGQVHIPLKLPAWKESAQQSQNPVLIMKMGGGGSRGY